MQSIQSSLLNLVYSFKCTPGRRLIDRGSCERPLQVLLLPVVTDMGDITQSILQSTSDPPSLMYLNMLGLLQFNPYGPHRVLLAPAPVCLLTVLPES